MKPVVAISIVFVSAMLVACAPQWVRLNDDRATDAAIAKARTDRHVERKLAALEQAELAKERRVSSAPSNQAKMLLKDDFTANERVVYAEIDACMQKQGFNRSR